MGQNEFKYSYDDFRQAISDRYSIPMEKLTDNCSLINDLGIDSLSLFNMMTALEDEIDVKLDIVEIIERDTIKGIYDYLISFKEGSVTEKQVI